MSDTPKPTPFNPAWLTPALVVITGIVSGVSSSAVNSRDVSELRTEQADMREWRRNTEKRLAEGEKTNAVSSAEVKKDLESLKAGIQSLQSALMVNPMAGQQRPQPHQSNLPTP